MLFFPSIPTAPTIPALYSAPKQAFKKPQTHPELTQKNKRNPKETLGLI